MRHGLVWLAAALAAAGCSFNVNLKETGVGFACNPDGTCDGNLVCAMNVCQMPDAAVPDGPPGTGGPSPTTCTTAVGAGIEHTCAILSDGAAWCWGVNDAGQLGDGTHDDSDVPVQVKTLAHATAIDGGLSHTCAIDQAGKLWCWGGNDGGQLGDGSSVNDSTTPVAVALPDPTLTAVQIAAGRTHSCAILSDHSLVCWGHDELGQLGDGGTVPHNTPIVVADVGAVIEVSAGGGHTCAIDTSHALWCWGDNGSGEIGNGAHAPRQGPPFKVALDNVTKVAAGDLSTCAMTGDGKVWCFGANNTGQLGLPLAADATLPVQAALPVAATTIVSGEHFVCALDAQHTVWCWGENFDNELADLTFSNRVTPVQTPYRDIVAIAAGRAHLCVQSSAGAVSCTGFNGRGELGDGERTTQSKPPAQAQLAGVAAVAGGDDHTCAVLADAAGTVECWGNNDAGQLGDGTHVGHAVAAPVSGLVGAVAIAAGRNHTCAVLGDASVVCWGGNNAGQLGDATNDTHGVARPVVDATGARITGVTQIAAAGDHTCALLGSGATSAVMCWGQNNAAQNGDGTLNDSNVATPASQVAAGVVGLGIGAFHSCAITAAGGVECWGEENFGELGNGVTAQNHSLKPVPAGTLTDIVELSAHGLFTCARASTGSVWCWGIGGDGQIGNGSFGSDVPVQSLKGSATGNAVKLSAGGAHVCAILSNDKTAATSLMCWGNGQFGQLGNGSYDDAVSPQAVLGLPQLSSVAAGGAHTCVVTDQKAMLCWGDGLSGQLGDGATTTLVPVAPKLVCPATM